MIPCLLLLLVIVLAADTGLALEARYYRVAADTNTTIARFTGGGLLTWSNPAPVSFQIQWSRGLESNQWRDIIIGDTTSRIASVTVPLRSRLVCFGVGLTNSGLWLTQSDGSWKSKIKDGGGNVGGFSISPDDQYVAYTENEGATFRLWVHEVQSGFSTNLTGGLGKSCMFDMQVPYGLLCHAGSSVYRVTQVSTQVQTLVTSPGYTISSFLQSPHGSPIVTRENNNVTGARRMVAYNYDGSLLRVLKDDHSSDCYNFYFDRENTGIVYTYRAPDCAGTRTAEVINLLTGVAHPLPYFLEVWPDSVGPHFVVWHPYTNLLSSLTNHLRSPVDGSFAGTYGTTPTLPVRGVDAQGYWYATDAACNQIVMLHPNP